MKAIAWIYFALLLVILSIQQHQIVKLQARLIEFMELSGECARQAARIDMDHHRRLEVLETNEGTRPRSLGI